MNSKNNKGIDRAINLVEGIQEKLIRLEIETGHSAEMAQVRRARREIRQLHGLLRSYKIGNNNMANWKLLLPLISELAYLLLKHTNQ